MPAATCRLLRASFCYSGAGFPRWVSATCWPKKRLVDELMRDRLVMRAQTLKVEKDQAARAARNVYAKRKAVRATRFELATPAPTRRVTKVCSPQEQGLAGVLANSRYAFCPV
jgi:hypothetical protein